MLTTLDLNRILRNARNFGGVWPSNALPLVIKKASEIYNQFRPKL